MTKKLFALGLILTIIIAAIPSGLVYASDIGDEEFDEFEALDNEFEEEVEKDDSVLVSTISDPKDLQDLIDTDVEYSSKDEINTKWSGSTTACKVNVDEEGWLFISAYGGRDDIDIELYSNFALTSKIGTFHVNSTTEDNPTLACYVKEGSYYYVISRWNGYEPLSLTTYAGFMPSSARIKVDKITYSKDKSKAAVTFDYDEEYLVNLQEGTLRVISGTVNYRDINKNVTWNVDNRENALETDIFYTTKNGTYTIRIAGSDKYFCKVSFEITDIVDKAPKTPSIKTYKVGTKTVSGTGTYGTTAYVKASGKYYKCVVNKKGEWTVKVPKLKKGATLTAYVKTSAGVKSKSTTKKVK